MDRRRFLASVSTSVVAAGAALWRAPSAWAASRREQSTSPGTAIGAASRVPVGGSASFRVPGNGHPGLVIQPVKGQFYAYDARCPHMGCTVGYSSAAKDFVCPCHHSTFAATSGACTAGPAFPRGLTRHPVTVVKGQLYVK